MNKIPTYCIDFKFKKYSIEELNQLDKEKDLKLYIESLFGHK